MTLAPERHEPVETPALAAIDRPVAPTRPRAHDPQQPLYLPETLAPLEHRVREYDLVLAGAAFVLSLIGAVLVWSATRGAQLRAHADPNAFLYRHLFNLIVTGGLLFAASRVNARLLRMIGPVVYVGSLIGLLAVFAIGSTINGAKAWIVLPGGFEIQPAEFTKLGLVIGLAVLFTQHLGERGHDGPPARREMLIAISLIGVPLLMIMLQPDLGSSLVVASSAFVVLVAAGVRARWTLGLLAAGVLATIGVFKSGLLAKYQVDRLTSFLHPHHDVLGAAYTVTQAHIAIANGGWFGYGLFHGPQTSGGFVPEQQTDFVYSVAGEEFGLVGAGLIIVLFAVLCWRGLRIARHADPTGRLLAVGVVGWFAFQAFENIGMNLGLTPVTGIPLPFVSYGGSSMFAQGLAIGLLEAVHRRAFR
ncbi:MAG: FtsW/RodA/SpoVE family cell cycle protein [Jatrophihabitans sp.]|uniref:FtsW/RodA/SpoVE family cell cycle protein n=1 Tax=Jatrophihabitans sp. TaxID=1932789 RepID=UPI003F7F7C1E